MRLPQWVLWSMRDDLQDSRRLQAPHWTRMPNSRQGGHGLFNAPVPPRTKAKYHVKELQPNLQSLTRYYPELLRCLQCNTCSRACPQDLPVIDMMAAAMRGDVSTAADLSFDCIMCGLCATRCPAEIVQYNVTILARRLYGTHVAPNPYTSKNA